MNRRDIDLLSAYLDGELKPSESARLESRLKADPGLVSALNDLRSTRAFLRKLPSRKAPRNFTLTRKMVGLNPPLPRTYPAFRFVTAVATLLFFFSFGINFVGTQMTAQANFGMGGGGAPQVEAYAEEAPAEEPAAPAPAASEPMDAAPTATGEPFASMAPQATQSPPSDDTTRLQETPSAKDGDTQNSVAPDQPSAGNEAPPTAQSSAPLVPSVWQIGLAALAAVSALLMGLMRQFSARRWK